MKLSKELKEKIDNYFNNIIATEVFEIAKKKYGFTECKVELENKNMKIIKKLLKSIKGNGGIYNTISHFLFGGINCNPKG
jgi:hypothetical protein